MCLTIPPSFRPLVHYTFSKITVATQKTGCSLEVWFSPKSWCEQGTKTISENYIRLSFIWVVAQVCIIIRLEMATIQSQLPHSESIRNLKFCLDQILLIWYYFWPFLNEERYKFARPLILKLLVSTKPWLNKSQRGMTWN